MSIQKRPCTANAIILNRAYSLTSPCRSFLTEAVAETIGKVHPDALVIRVAAGNSVAAILVCCFHVDKSVGGNDRREEKFAVGHTKYQENYEVPHESTEHVRERVGRGIYAGWHNLQIGHAWKT